MPQLGPYTAAMPRRIGLLLLLVAVTTAACLGSSSTATLQPPPSKLPTTPTDPSLTPTPSRTPTTVPGAIRTPTVQATWSARAPLGCPPPPTEIPTPPIEDVSEYGEMLLAYLNHGGSIERLAAYASEVHLLGDVGVDQGYATPDLDGDGIPEIAISLANFAEDENPGTVYVARCAGNRYELAYQVGDDMDYPTAQIYAVFDATGDGLVDLIIRQQGCGAHTCFEWLQVLSAHGFGATLRNRMADVYVDLPSTSFQFYGPMTDGSVQLVMTGNGVASVGAGPYHRRALTWVWQSEQDYFAVDELRYLPSEYRIHTVHDADRSYALRNYPLAMDIYNRVIHDSSLREWPTALVDPEVPAARGEELKAYARFRRVLTRLKMNDFASAEIHYQDLLENHPSGAAGAGFAQMGKSFWEAYAATDDFDAACRAAQDFAAAHTAEVIDPLYYGYSNPSYTPAGLCPIGP